MLCVSPSVSSSPGFVSGVEGPSTGDCFASSLEVCFSTGRALSAAGRGGDAFGCATGVAFAAAPARQVPRSRRLSGGP